MTKFSRVSSKQPTLDFFPEIRFNRNGIFSKNATYVTKPYFAKELATKVSTVEDVAWQNSSLQIFICFHHFFVPFRGFEAHPWRFFFMKPNNKWTFFSNILIHSIDLEKMMNQKEEVCVLIILKLVQRWEQSVIIRYSDTLLPLQTTAFIQSM